MARDNEDSPPRGWRNSDILRAVALALLLWIALQFLWVARSVFIVLIIAVLVGIAMVPAVDWLERHRLKRGLAAGLVMLLIVGVITGLILLTAPVIRRQSGELRQKLPEVIDSIEKKLGAGTEITDLLPSQKPATGQPAQTEGTGSRGDKSKEVPQKRQSLRERLSGQVGGILGMLFPFVSGALAAIGALFLIIFVAIYIAADPSLYETGLIHLIPRKSRPRGLEVLHEVTLALRNWLVARILAMIAVGLVTLAALLALRVKAAMVLSLISGLLEIIPFFGPIVSSLPAMGMALIDSPQKALSVAAAFFVIQQLEGNLITPLLLKKRVHIPPALTIGTVVLMGVVFGVAGMLVAEPLLAATLVAVKMLYVEDKIGDQVEKGSS